MPLRILLIDDDRELCEEVAEFLRDQGFLVENTSDSSEGEALAETQEFDIALLDFKMEGLTGIDIAQKIRHKNPRTKIYLVTGRPFMDRWLEDENMVQWVDGIISKPFKQDVILEKIRNLLPKS